MFEKVLRRLRIKVIAIMHQNGRVPFFSLATGLWALSQAYAGVMQLRGLLFRKGYLSRSRLPCPVISVGNITMGGTGKTPLTLHLARMILKSGYKVAIISRGYKGQYEKQGAVVSDGRSVMLDALQAGDEPFLMATHLANVPLVVGHNRYAAGCLALRRFKPDLILLDDAFQHQQLERDLDLVLLDASDPFGNHFLFPRGPLREPVSSLLRADAIILTRCNDTMPSYLSRLVEAMQPRPVFRAFHHTFVRHFVQAGCIPAPEQNAIATQNTADPLAGRILFAFCGLGRNSAFYDTVRHMDGHLVGTLDFDDHHPYSPLDISRIVQAAGRAGADCLVTTEKDFVRIPWLNPLPLDMAIMDMEMDFAADQDRWSRFITDQLLALVKP